MQTILDRDLRQIYKTKLTFSELYHFISEIAKFEGKPYDYQYFKKITGLSPITQKNLLYAFESIFLVRRIPIEGTSPTFTILLEDQGESYLLSEGNVSLSEQMTSLLYRNLRSEMFYKSGSMIKVFRFRNRSGNVMPIAFESKGSVVGFMYSLQENIDRKTKANADVFLRNYSNSKVIILS